MYYNVKLQYGDKSLERKKWHHVSNASGTTRKNALTADLTTMNINSHTFLFILHGNFQSLKPLLCKPFFFLQNYVISYSDVIFSQDVCPPAVDRLSLLRNR